MIFGRLGSLGAGFGRLGSGGSANDPLAPGAPLSVAAEEPVTNPPALIIALRQGEGAPLDTAEGDIIQIGFGAASVDTESDPLDAAAIIAGEINYTNGEIASGSTIIYARVKRPGTPDRFSLWTASDAIPIPATGGTGWNINFWWR